MAVLKMEALLIVFCIKQILNCNKSLYLIRNIKKKKFTSVKSKTIEYV